MATDKNDRNYQRQKELSEKLLIKLADVSDRMEKMNLAEYINLLNNPRRYLWLHFFGGIVRGLGVAVGATLLAALLIYLLQKLVMLNLPLIGDFIADIVRIVQTNL